MDLRNLTDSDLENSITKQVAIERSATTSVLHYLREIERRRLFAQRGFSSLYDYCTRFLGYSEAQAQRRISSSRLLGQLPELDEKISSGKLNLSVVSQAQSFFHREAKAENSYSDEQKTEVLEKLENQSARNAEKILVSMASAPPKPKETVRPMRAEQTEVRFSADPATMQYIGRLREILAGKIPDGAIGQLISAALKIAVESVDPLVLAEKRERRRRQQKNQSHEKNPHLRRRRLNRLNHYPLNLSVVILGILPLMLKMRSACEMKINVLILIRSQDKDVYHDVGSSTTTSSFIQEGAQTRQKISG